MEPFAQSLRSPSISSPQGQATTPSRKMSTRKSLSNNFSTSGPPPVNTPIPAEKTNTRSDSIRTYQSDNVVVDLEQLPLALQNNSENQGLQSPQLIRDTFNNLSSTIKKTNVAFDFQSKQNVRKNNIWEPPNACQRRIMPISNYQQYFPIELTSRDYFHRAISLIIIIIDFLNVEKLEKFQKPPKKSHEDENEDIPMKLEEFMNLLLAQLSTKAIYETTQKLHLLSNLQNKKISENILNYINIILDIKDQLFQVTTVSYHYDYNALQDDLNPLFDTVYYFLLLIQEFLLFPTLTHSNTTTSVTASTLVHHINIDTIILEIKDLQSQWKLQKVFQLQKLSYLGWDISPPPPPTGPNNILGRSFTEGNNGNGNMEETKDSLAISYDEIVKKSEIYKKRIQAILLNSSEKNTIMLIIRIYTIIEDLTILSNEIGEVGDYQEAYRIRQLLTSIDLSINSNYSSQIIGRQSMNRPQPEIDGYNDFSKLLLQSDYIDFRKYLDALYIFKNDFYRLLLELIQLFEKEKLKNDYTKMIVIENILNDLNDYYSQLLYITRKVSLINQENVVNKIHLEGTNFLTSNFLFVSEYEDEKCNLASLLIKSESEYLLQAIETWPELTLLNRSLFNQVMAQQSLQNADALPDIPTESQSITDNSYGNNSSLALRNNNNQSLTLSNSRNVNGNGFTSSMILSNSSQMKKEFSLLIYETLQSFELLLKQLNILLTQESLAHSELICRLIGIRDDLYSLIEVNTHATNQIEAERLLEMVSIIDNTIDADEQDNLLHHQYLFTMSSNNMMLGNDDGGGDNTSGGYNPALVAHSHPYAASTHQLSEIGRGRKRIDNIYQFMKNILEGLNELNKLKLRAKSINDFIAIKSIDKMMTILKTKVELLEKSINPFHLLDHENDISSTGGSNLIQSNGNNHNNNNNNNNGGQGSMTNPHHPRIAQNLILDINERIAREGTEFLTSDFVFSYCCGPKGHSIGSLAIVAGCGAVLRYIKTYWPAFTILGSQQGNGGNGNGDGENRMLSMSNDSAFIHHHPSVHMGNHGRMPVSDITNIDFRNANTLRLLGFDAKSIQLAGFSTIDILTAGFTAEQLKSTGFGIEMIRAIPYFDHYFTRAIGYQLETQGKILIELFYCTNGLSWKKNEFWKELENLLKQISSSTPIPTTSTSAPNSPVRSTMGNGSGATLNNSNAMIVPSLDNVNNLLNNSKSQQQIVLLSMLKKLFGVTVQEPNFDANAVYAMGGGGGGGGGGNNNNLNTSGTNLNTSASNASLTNGGNNSMISTVNNNSMAMSGMMNSNLGGSNTSSAMGGGAKNVNSSEVTKIILIQNNLNGVLPNGLGSLTSLVNLTLSFNGLKGEIPASIGLLIHLDILCLDHNQLEGEIPRTFKNLAQLTILRLENNRLSGSLPTSLGNLTKLKRLDVTNNQLSGPLPQRFGTGLSKVQELLLGNNQFSGEIPLTWTQLTNLTHLELQNNQLFGALPLNWSKLTKLTGLNLQNNRGLLVDRLTLQKSLPKCRIKL